jgi:hypothetical protein
VEIKKTIFNPLIIVIVVAVIFAIGVDIYVIFNIKSEPYYADNPIVTNSTRKVTTTDKTNPNDVKEADYEAVKNAASANIVTDTSVTSGWKTYTGNAFDGHSATIKYPADWFIYGDGTLYLKKSSHTTSDTGSYEIVINKYYYKDDATFTDTYGPGKLVNINNYSAKYAYLFDNNIYSDNYLITIGDSKYLCAVMFQVPSDKVGEQILSTFQVK